MLSLTAKQSILLALAINVAKSTPDGAPVSATSNPATPLHIADLATEQ